MLQLQARYRVRLQALDRGRTLAGFAAATAGTRLKKCIAEGDVANACFLAADLVASGHAMRLVEALVDACASPGVLAPALALGAAEDVIDFGALAPTADVANDATARHLAVQAVVRLCLLGARPARDDKRGAAIARLAAAKLRDLQAEGVRLLQATVAPNGETGLLPKLLAALGGLRQPEEEATRLRLASLVARAAPASTPAIVAHAAARLAQYPHARVALALHAMAARPKPALLLAALVGPAPLAAAPWTDAERNNVTFAVLRAHTLFEAVADHHADAAEDEEREMLAAATAGRAPDPAVARGIDAAFRRKARLDALYRVA